MKNTIITLLCVIAVQTCFSQKITLDEIGLFAGASTTSANKFSDWERNALKLGLDTVKTMSYGESSRNSNQYGVFIGLRIDNHKNINHKIRLGFSGGSYSLNWDESYNKNDIYRIDTFISQQHGTMYFVDSIRGQSSYFFQDARMFNLHACYQVIIRPEKKISAYSGAGITAGFSINNYTTNYYSEYSSGSNAYYSYSNPYDYIYIEKRKDLSTAVNINMYVPFGLNYRLSNRNNILSHINIFAEYRLGMEVNKLQEITTNIGFMHGGAIGTAISFSGKPRRKR